MDHLLKLITVCNCLAATTTLPCSINLSCMASHSHGQTTFSLPDRPEFIDDSCQYSWCNKTGNVIANQLEGAPGLVLKHSVRSLVTSGCQDTAIYEGRCGPKWEKLIARCTYPCTMKPMRPEEIPGQKNAAVTVLSYLALWCFQVLLICF